MPANVGTAAPRRDSAQEVDREPFWTIFVVTLFLLVLPYILVRVTSDTSFTAMVLVAFGFVAVGLQGLGDTWNAFQWMTLVTCLLSAPLAWWYSRAPSLFLSIASLMVALLATGLTVCWELFVFLQFDHPRISEARNWLDVLIPAALVAWLWTELMLNSCKVSTQRVHRNTAQNRNNPRSTFRQTGNCLKCGPRVQIERGRCLTCGSVVHAI